ncbi:hypothetical protein MMC18_006510 [Xylographa bjoerkii]|nr:hypothetical protein [Xylographa bjoerkii]
MEAATDSLKLGDEYPEDKLLLKIGHGEIKFVVAKSLLVQIPFFSGMLHAGTQFKKSTTGTVDLPEDEPDLWLLALEFLTLGEYFPYLRTKSTESHSRAVDWDINYPYWLQPDLATMEGNRKKECLATPIHVINWSGNIVEYDREAARIGQWSTTDSTHHLFKQTVQLFVMAEKYIWHELMDMCVRKIRAFPLGARAFSILTEYCTMPDYCQDVEDTDSDEEQSISYPWATEADIDDNGTELTAQEFLLAEGVTPCRHPNGPRSVSNIRNQMRQILDDLFAFHTAYYDESKMTKGAYTLRARRANEQDDYQLLDKFLEDSMTPEAWVVVQKMTRQRNDRLKVLGHKYLIEGESCIAKRTGVLKKDWTAATAEAAHVQWTKRDGQRSRRYASWNWVKGSVQFTESRKGDLISGIQLHSSIRPFVYGMNQRTQKLGCFDPQILGFSAEHSADERKHDRGPCPKCESGLQLIQGIW